jgi:hypothetical protein
VVDETPARLRSIGGPPSFTSGARAALHLTFSGEIWYWRGPAPYYFVTVPEPLSRRIGEVAAEATYGWGMIPVHATIGETTWYTAMFARGGGYVLPVKVAIRRAEGVDDGDVVAVTLDVLESGQPHRR